MGGACGSLPPLTHCMDSCRGPGLHAPRVLPAYQPASTSRSQAEPYSHGEYQAWPWPCLFPLAWSLLKALFLSFSIKGGVKGDQ